jgi:hypothetical protein
VSARRADSASVITTSAHDALTPSSSTLWCTVADSNPPKGANSLASSSTLSYLPTPPGCAAPPAAPMSRTRRARLPDCPSSSRRRVPVVPRLCIPGTPSSAPSSGEVAAASSAQRLAAVTEWTAALNWRFALPWPWVRSRECRRRSSEARLTRASPRAQPRGVVTGGADASDSSTADAILWSWREGDGTAVPPTRWRSSLASVRRRCSAPPWSFSPSTSSR